MPPRRTRPRGAFARRPSMTRARQTMVAFPDVAAAHLEIRRTLPAPRWPVFKASTEAAHVKCWFGPRGFTTPGFEGDLRPGGDWHARMRSPDGKEYRLHGVVSEVTEPSRFAFSVIWEDDAEQERLVEVDLAEK